MSKARGFTLLELLVVLVLLGLAAALVGPASLRSLERWRAADALQMARAAVHGLPLQARRMGRRLEIDGAQAPLEGLPASVQLQVIRPWSVTPEGFCSYGEADIVQDGVRRRIRVMAPYCRTIWADA